MRRSITVLITLALGAAVLSATPTTSAAPPGPAATTAAAAQVPVINWQPCDEALCARVRVPLDYDDPTGATTRLNLLKIPAAKPDQRIGSLFVNPGGPGATATDFARFFPFLVRPAVSNRFDIIGIDPRGTFSPATICRADGEPPFPVVSFPVTDSQVAVWLRHDAWQRRACRTGATAITDHMTTADDARDMDLIRQAVGDDKLTYYGISYGTYLGQTYAAMYPDNIRALIIDGVLDPVAWATGRNGNGTKVPFSTRLKSGYGAADALSTALTACNQSTHCVLRGRAHRTWNQLVHRLRQGPSVRHGQRLTYADLVSSTLGLLYSADSYPFLMRVLNQAHRQVFAKSAPRRPLALLRPVPADPRGIAGPYGATPTSGNQPGYGQISDAFHAVACADTLNPSDPAVWAKAARRFEPAQPYFGRLWTWASSPCARWPKAASADAFRGPFATTTSAPLLVIGNSHDPATPISGARVATHLFAGSRLLQLNGWGHGAIMTSNCIDNAMRDYLVSLTLPAEGATCDPNRPLFR
ncbi:alpha/beta hydrolase [Nocardioides sp.]|uniref:alpha/beta hydrolase n=1 Tax=Nocardioides sp. TaxID=35761 RepID=UPI003D0CD658